jgi:hypothetical protein
MVIFHSYVSFLYVYQRVIVGEYWNKLGDEVWNVGIVLMNFGEIREDGRHFGNQMWNLGRMGES